MTSWSLPPWAGTLQGCHEIRILNTSAWPDHQRHEVRSRELIPGNISEGWRWRRGTGKEESSPSDPPEHNPPGTLGGSLNTAFGITSGQRKLGNCLCCWLRVASIQREGIWAGSFRCSPLQASEGGRDMEGRSERIPSTWGHHLYDLSYQVHHLLGLLLQLQWWQLLRSPVVTWSGQSDFHIHYGCFTMWSWKWGWPGFTLRPLQRFEGKSLLCLNLSCLAVSWIQLNMAQETSASWLLFSEPDLFSDQDPFVRTKAVLYVAGLGSTPFRPIRTTTQLRLWASELPGSLPLRARRGQPSQFTYYPHSTDREVEARKGDGFFWGHITISWGPSLSESTTSWFPVTLCSVPDKVSGSLLLQQGSRHKQLGNFFCEWLWTCFKSWHWPDMPSKREEHGLQTWTTWPWILAHLLCDSGEIT